MEKRLIVPGNNQKVLLHSCCAVCSGPLIEQMINSDIELTLFFYNPNIHPRKEYEIRKNENKQFAKKLHVPFVDADYDVQDWFSRTKGLEKELERGKRCTMCFDIRMNRTALYAFKHRFKVITSSLSISRWKDISQVHRCGFDAAAKYDGMIYWDYNWRKWSNRVYELAKQEGFYRQKYCGCIYSQKCKATC